MHGKLWTELLKNHGEDAEPVLGENIAAVFDGVGGRGGFQHKNRDRSSAYLGSRIFAAGFKTFFCRPGLIENLFRELSESPEKENVLKKYGDQLSIILSASTVSYMKKMEITDKERPKGKFFKMLPSTMSAAVFQENENTVEIVAVWAGDSRSFVLQESGLKQISTDDELLAEGEEVRNYWDFLNKGDMPMSNFLNASDPFHVNLRYITVEKPCIVFTGTDGTFGYVESANPLNLEKMWLDFLIAANSLDDFCEKMRQHYEAARRDDCTLTVNTFGFDEYSQVKEFAVKRRELFEAEYIAVIEKAERYNELEEKKRIAGQKLIHRGEVVKDALIPIIKKELLSNLTSEGSEAFINFKNCPSVENFLAELQKHENAQDEEIEMLQNRNYLDELKSEIKENWMELRSFLKHEEIAFSDFSEKKMEEYEKLKKQYDNYLHDLKSNMDAYQGNIKEIFSRMDALFEQMKQDTVSSEQAAELRKLGKLMREQTNRSALEYKINHRNLMEMKAELDEAVSGIIECDLLMNEEILEAVKKYILSHDIRGISQIPESVSRMKECILQDDERIMEIQKQKDIRSQHREEMYEMYYENNADELYEWAIQNYSNILLRKLPEEMRENTADIENEIKEYTIMQTEFEPYRSFTWERLWENYRKGFEVYQHEAIIRSECQTVLEGYEKYIELRNRSNNVEKQTENITVLKKETYSASEEEAEVKETEVKEISSTEEEY